MKNFFFLFPQVYSRKGGGRKTVQGGALRIFISTYDVLDVFRGAGATVVSKCRPLRVHTLIEGKSVFNVLIV